jgi:hypothetical protein
MNIISHTSGTYIKYINSLNNEITINISLISIQQNEIIPNYTTNSKKYKCIKKIHHNDITLSNDRLFVNNNILNKKFKLIQN